MKVMTQEYHDLKGVLTLIKDNKEKFWLVFLPKMLINKTFKTLFRHHIPISK